MLPEQAKEILCQEEVDDKRIPNDCETPYYLVARANAKYEKDCNNQTDPIPTFCQLVNLLYLQQQKRSTTNRRNVPDYLDFKKYEGLVENCEEKSLELIEVTDAGIKMPTTQDMIDLCIETLPNATKTYVTLNIIPDIHRVIRLWKDNRRLAWEDIFNVQAKYRILKVISMSSGI